MTDKRTIIIHKPKNVMQYIFDLEKRIEKLEKWLKSLTLDDKQYRDM